jgi:hypothetical protein
MNKIKLELTPEEINFMMKPFLRMPFQDVANFINYIQDQIDPQLEELQLLKSADPSIGPGEEIPKEE